MFTAAFLNGGAGEKNPSTPKWRDIEAVTCMDRVCHGGSEPILAAATQSCCVQSTTTSVYLSSVKAAMFDDCESLCLVLKDDPP